MRHLSIIYVFSVLLLLGCQTDVPTSPNGTLETDDSAVDAEGVPVAYDQIQDGMTLAEVEALLGPGRELSRSEVKGVETSVYSWPVNDIESVTAVLEDGVVTSKAQIGPVEVSESVTQTAYDQISDGMALQEVEAILGSGEEISSSTLDGTTTEVYSWQGPDLANIVLTFQDGALVSKTQFGLQE